MPNLGKDALMGAEIGSLIPGVGTAIGAGTGAALGLVTSGIEGISAARSRRQANQQMPSLYDPQQLAMLAEINERRKAYTSGSGYSAQMGDIDATTAATLGQVSKATGGDVGSTISGLLAAQNQANMAKNAVFAQGDKQLNFYNTFASDLQNKIAQRALELKLAGRSQDLAQWAQSSQDAFGNAANSAARMNTPTTPKIDWADLMARHGASNAGVNIPGIEKGTSVFGDTMPSFSYSSGAYPEMQTPQFGQAAGDILGGGESLNAGSEALSAGANILPGLF